MLFSSDPNEPSRPSRRRVLPHECSRVTEAARSGQRKLKDTPVTRKGILAFRNGLEELIDRETRTVWTSAEPPINQAPWSSSSHRMVGEY